MGSGVRIRPNSSEYLSAGSRQHVHRHRYTPDTPWFTKNYRHSHLGTSNLTPHTLLLASKWATRVAIMWRVLVQCNGQSASNSLRVQVSWHTTFFGGNSHVASFVDALATRFGHYASFVDIGAGAYNGADESLALRFHRRWSFPGHQVRVLAIEPSASNPIHTLAADTGGAVRTFKGVVSDRGGKVPFYAYSPRERSKATIATANPRIVHHPVSTLGRRCGLSTLFQLTACSHAKT